MKRKGGLKGRTQGMIWWNTRLAYDVIPQAKAINLRITEK
jgi:O-glycosyl hydrolase